MCTSTFMKLEISVSGKDDFLVHLGKKIIYEEKMTKYAKMLSQYRKILIAFHLKILAKISMLNKG